MKVIHLYTVWAQPCRQHQKIIDLIKPEFPDVEFEDIDIESNDSIIEKYSIRSVPTTIIEVDGKVVEKRSGIIPKSDLIELINLNK